MARVSPGARLVNWMVAGLLLGGLACLLAGGLLAIRSDLGVSLGRAILIAGVGALALFFLLLLAAITTAARRSPVPTDPLAETLPAPETPRAEPDLIERLTLGRKVTKKRRAP